MLAKVTGGNYNPRLTESECGVGVWRSLVAHLHGVQGVEGSNPFTPTKNSESRFQKRLFCRPYDYDVEYAATDIQMPSENRSDGISLS